MFLATAITGITTALTILIHFEAILLLNKWREAEIAQPRVRVVLGVFFLFVAHSIEIWLFALAMYISKNHLELGGLEGAFNETWADYLYISVVTYGSVGYGDIHPTGFIRTICGFEALTGIMMMAWSASYTVFRLQDHWR